MISGPTAALGAYAAALAAEAGEELTLEAALAFVDNCSVESDVDDDDDDAARAAPARRRASLSKRAKRPTDGNAAARQRLEAPPSPRFFALVDDFQQGLDIEEDISVEDVLRLVDAGSAAAKPRSEAKRRRLARKEPSESDSDSPSSSSQSAARPARKPRHKSAEDALAAPAAERAETEEERASNDNADGAETEETAKPKKKRIRRQREELLYLRAKVSEMQQMLDDLHNGIFPSESGSSSSESPGSSPVARQSQPQAQYGAATMRRMHWKLHAQTQLAERQRAEQENQHLKATLDGQLQLSKRLERLIISQDPSEGLETPPQPKRCKTQFGGAFEDDASLLLDLKQELERAFPVFEQQLAASYLHDLRGEKYNVQVKSSANASVFIEFTASKIIPHGLDATRKGIWRLMSRDGLMRNSFYYHELEKRTSDFAVRDFGVTIDLKHRNLDILGKQAIRKVDQLHRTVLLWSAVVEPVRSSGTLPSGVRFRERGWLVMQPLDAAPHSTIIKVHITFTPDVGSGDASSNLAVAAISELMIDSVENNLHSGQDLVNEFIVEEEWRASTRSVAV